MPDLSAELLAFVRVAYGVLLLGTLIYTLPQARRFFVSERWHGYAESTRLTDLLQNPYALWLVLGVWAACAGLLIAGWLAPGAALVNLLLCRYYFVAMRWRGVHRGMGAPGFMTYWLGLVVFLLEFTHHYAPAQRPLVVLVAQADFALLYLSSGVYKLMAGYVQGEGMDLGMVNPQWGYWWRSIGRMRPSHPLFAVSNQAGWFFEILAVVLMLLPWTRFWGGALLIVSFAYVALFIRLGLLAEVVMLTGVLYFDVGSLGDQLLAPVGAALPASTAPAITLPAIAGSALAAVLWVYLAILPLAYLGLHVNFYAKRRIPEPLQTALERYTNFFGMIIWRVFSVDIVNFSVHVHAADESGARREITAYGWRAGSLRYSHVGESITLTCLFTTLKYYPSNNEIFRRRLTRYARTLPLRPGEAPLFEVRQIVKRPDRFELVPIAEFRVDPESSQVTERRLSDEFSVRGKAAVSPIHEGSRPGSYVPLGS